MTQEYEDFLAHYGVKGQKWGFRRYQNNDGSLTEEGKKHYLFGGNDDPKKWKKEDASKLSDDELNRRNQRLQRESQYIQSLESRNKKPAKPKSIIRSEISSAAKAIFVASAVKTLSALMTMHYKTKLKNSEFIKSHFPEYVDDDKKK